MLKIICFVALSYLLIVTNVVRCKPDYLFNEDARGWLKLHWIPATWQEAFLRCQYEGAVLASPLVKQLADALKSQMTLAGVGGPIFLGTHDLYSKGNFFSLEGVPLSKMDIKWSSRDNGVGSGDCLTMSAGGSSYFMTVSSCTERRPFICYRRLDYNETMNECGTFDNEYHFKRCTGSCYKVHQQIRTWSQAFGICASEGGHLVILNDKDEARIVKDLFPERSEQGVWDRFHVGLAAWSDDRIWTTIHDVVRCKPDYMINEEARGWLKLHRTPATWEEALLRCHYEGAVLASPLDRQLADALHTLVTQSDLDDYIFLGTHDLFSKGDFVSVEGVPLADMEISWGRNDIGIATGDCYILSSTVPYVMHASSCTNPLPYICYRKLDNLTMNECGTFDNEYHFKPCTGSCYKVHYQKQTWSSAYRICAAEGGHLVILNDKEEARIVKEMFPVRDENADPWEQFHIGLLAWGEDRTWITIHGERVEDVYHDWNPGQPDNYGGNQDHATLIRAGYLDDGNPGTRAMFVCEKSPESIRFETLPQGIEERVQ